MWLYYIDESGTGLNSRTIKATPRLLSPWGRSGGYGLAGAWHFSHAIIPVQSGAPY